MVYVMKNIKSSVKTKPSDSSSEKSNVENVNIIKLELDVPNYSPYLIEVKKPYRSKLISKESECICPIVEVEEYVDIEEQALHDQAKWAINFLIDNTHIFNELVKKKPSLVINDYVIQKTIRYFQNICLTQPRDRANKARRILKDASLTLFIPKDAPRGQPRDVRAFLAKHILGFLYLEVQGMAKSIKKYYRPPYKTYFNNKKVDIKEAFNAIFNREMPDDLIYGERDKDLISIAIAFTTQRYDFTFEMLRKLYFEHKKKKDFVKLSNNDSTEKDLEYRIIKHPHLIEPGLRYLEHQCHTSSGSGRLDILFADSNNTLVVVELKVVKDSSMLIQAFAYFDSVADKIEGFARLDAIQNIDVERYPRRMLIAPSFTPLMINRC